MLSSIDVNNRAAENMHSAMGSFSPHEHYAFTNSSDGVALVGTAGDLHRHQHIEQARVQQLEQQQSQEASYPSPASTMSSGGGSQSPHAQTGSAPVGVSPNMPISTSSELAFALENKSEQQVG